jgi:hypothetical protein
LGGYGTSVWVQINGSACDSTCPCTIFDGTVNAGDPCYLDLIDEAFYGTCNGTTTTPGP